MLTPVGCVIFLDWGEQFCHADGDYHTASCAWNDSFQKWHKSLVLLIIINVFTIKKL